MNNRVLIVKYLPPRRRRRRPLPGDDGEGVYEVSCYLGRRQRGDGMYVYEIWCLAEPQLAGVAALPLQLSVDRELGLEAASGLGEDLKAAIGDVTADRVEGMVWKIDDLSENQVAGLLDLPDRLQALAVTPLDTLACTAGLPAPAASFTSDVAGTILLKPITEPFESVLHGLEVVGTIIGLLTGAHGLVVTCIKHLAYDKLGSILSHGFGRAIEAAGEALRSELSSTAAVEAAGEVTGSAAASSPSWADLAAANHEPAAPQRRVPTVAGTAGREGRGITDPGHAVALSAEDQRRLRRLRETGMISGGEQDAASVTDHREIARHSPAEMPQVHAAAIDDPPAVSYVSSSMTAI